MPMSETTNRRPVLLGLAASAVLTVLVVVGSRNLEHYDPALFGYTVASVVAFGALVYRYAGWLRRPATRVVSVTGLMLTASSLSIILWWRPASRRHTSSGYIRSARR